MMIRFAVVPPRASWPLPPWAIGLVVIAIAALLAALSFVLREAVARGVAMRQAATVQADSAWRCSHLQGRPSVDACLQRRSAAP